MEKKGVEVADENVTAWYLGCMNDGLSALSKEKVA